MKKALSLILAIMMLVSAIPAAYATTDVSNGTLVEYNADDQDGDGQLDNLDYVITVPAKLAPAGSGTVTLEGMWPSNATVKVTAEKTVELVNSITGADEKVLDVTFLGIEKAGNNTERKTYTETVSVADISAALFGTWEGVFNYNVEYDNGQPKLINIAWFDGTITQAEEGMTWAQWCDSEYRNDWGCPPQEGTTWSLWLDIDEDGYVGIFETYDGDTVFPNGWLRISTDGSKDMIVWEPEVLGSDLIQDASTGAIYTAFTDG